MQISTREKRILLLAGVVAIAFAITNALPMLQNLYDERNQRIEQINLEIEQERRLFEDSIVWRNRRAEAEEIGAELTDQVFTGETIPIVEANIQQAVTQQARESRITLTSTRLAERLEADGWIMVRQEFAFRTTNAANTIDFLENLDDSQPRLWVTDFSIDRARNNYSGSITVVGFALSEGLLVAQNRNR